MNNPLFHYDLDRGPKLAIKALLLVLAALLLFVLFWMTFARLDISVQAIGQVIPSSRIQLVQSLEGGIIRDIAVREGQQVKKGDLLAYVENLQYDAELGEGRQNRWAREAAIARLDAELNQRQPVFPDEIRKNAPDLVAEQHTLWLTRQRERDTLLETARRQIAQRQEELAEAKARAASLASLLAQARESLVMEQSLLEQGAGARADFMRAQMEVTRLQGDLEAARISVPRIQAAIQEANSRAAEVTSRYRAEASRERSQLESELAALSEKITASQDRVARREIRAQSDGVVNRLLISTVGGVAKAGETIMELVPVKDTLLISTRVKPSDIAFIRPGQSAIVRITAYDASIFGTLDAKVVRVGADAVLDERKQEQYFEVFMETSRNYLGKPEEKLTISSGMAADASIRTGKRSVMEYLLKPVVKTLDKSLRER
jgi:adhesin transport system membrane fusion protein